MIQAIVLVPTPAEIEYARLLIAIETRTRRVAALEAEREALEAALSRFAVELQARIGGHRAEINRLRLELAEYKRRIERLREDGDIDPVEVERQVAEEFAVRREAERAAEETARRRGEAYPPQAAQPQTDPGTEADILRLYRDLARRVHPDLARTEEERRRRSELMLRINVAYRDRDLLALQSLAREATLDDPVSPARSSEGKRSWAARVVARLDRTIVDLEAKVVALRRSDTYLLWQSPEASRAALDDLEAKTRQRLLVVRDRRDEVAVDYRRLVARRGAAPAAFQRARPTAPAPSNGARVPAGSPAGRRESGA